MAEDVELHRVRLFGVLLVVANLMAAFLIRTLGGKRALRSLWGVDQVSGEMWWLTTFLALAAFLGTALVVGVLVSCFWSFYAEHDRNPFVGEEFMPAWSDAGIIALLLVTCGAVVWSSFF